MQKNMGNIDRIIRGIMALLMLYIYKYDLAEGWIKIGLLIFAIAFIITSIISFCPVYSLLGINTCKYSEGKI